MTWVETFSGAAVSLVAPQPSDIRVGDIVAHLSVIPRFLGAARLDFADAYALPRVLAAGAECERARLPCVSVAQHSVLVRDIIAQRSPDDAGARLWALLHDAHEAYIGDITTPMQHALAALGGPVEALRTLQERLDRAIAARFGMAWVDVVRARAAVKRADLSSLLAERDAGMISSGRPWCIAADAAGVLERLRPMTPAEAAHEFAAALHEELVTYNARRNAYKRTRLRGSYA